jgi:hypothetical protein
VRDWLDTLQPSSGLKPSLRHLQENRTLPVATGSARPVHALFCVLSKLFGRHDTLSIAYLLPQQFRHLNDGILKWQADFRSGVEIAVEKEELRSPRAWGGFKCCRMEQVQLFSIQAFDGIFRRSGMAKGRHRKLVESPIFLMGERNRNFSILDNPIVLSPRLTIVLLSFTVCFLLEVQSCWPNLCC